MKQFKVWFPEDGETEEDAVILESYFEYVGDTASEYDYHNRDGWERGFDEFEEVHFKEVDGDGTIYKTEIWLEAAIHYCGGNPKKL